MHPAKVEVKKPQPSFLKAELWLGVQALPSQWAHPGSARVRIPGSSWVGTEGTFLLGPESAFQLETDAHGLLMYGLESHRPVPRLPT